jgi:hypothetical protein
MSVCEIPLNDYAESFTVELAGAPYTFKTKWNDALGAWVLDIGKSSDEWLIRNLAIVTGGNLLEQYEHLNLGFELYAVTDGKPETDPSANLGTDSHLYAVTD